ncbi:site-specific recombinase XerD [Branchiibius hedensis]|uniref:Site-specific recombinase XerD n=1 Tax=Branchiibius hedensis TaxID=672460 RepID=A0A2Y8ZLA8_9MICO|nr:site-specific integrase [Branchiibius hedensis]PWJ22820.1 site-specific recombinase XerD [Branchiibius hedensis]PWJ23937.1 site-specific recombinase XerD [Branchiibius hedensis]SSA32755.1 Site-specific recombinase XerD [Branchiibius hedensis]SSA59169.1 Site-specific recombinase XerD [Branchiibius hedensis]
MGRAKGTGSVFERGRDGQWAWQLDVGFTASGNRRRITQGGYPTKKAAQTALSKKLREVAANGVPAITGRTTVKRWSEQWLAAYAKHVRPATYRAASSAVHQHIITTIGGKQLGALLPTDVRAVHRSALRDGNSTSTALRTHAVLTTMLKAAKAEGHTVPENVFAVRRPTKAVSDRDAIPLEDALRLLEAARTGPDAARWVAALLQGMRKGEIYGLTWDAVDLDRGLIDISWQLQALTYADRSAGTFQVPDGYEVRHLTGATHLVRPKTTSGQRIVPLVPWMRAALAEWEQVAPANPWNLVWTENGQRPMRDKTNTQAWHGLQATAGVIHPAGRPYTLHEARHTAATLLMQAGIDPEVIKAIMGHSSIVTSRGYMHVNTEMARAALSAVAATLGLNESVPPHLLEQAGGMAHSNKE